MALDRALAGEPIDIGALGEALAMTPTYALYKSDAIEVIRLVLTAGKEFRRHAVPGAITVQGLEGEVDFETPDRVTRLRPGTLLCLEGSTPHSLRPLSDASLLLTIVLAPRPAECSAGHEPP